MIPISLFDQIVAINVAREAIEADPTPEWREYLEGWNGPEKAAAVADLAAERKRIAASMKLPSGVQVLWHATGEMSFRAVLYAYQQGTRYLGVFDTPEAAHEAHRKAHIEHYGERSRYLRQRAFDDGAPKRKRPNTQASLQQRPTKSGLPTGVIKRSAKSGDRYSAVIAFTDPDGDRCQRMISTHDTPEEAHRAYQIEHIKIHGEDSRYWAQRNALGVLNEHGGQGNDADGCPGTNARSLVVFH